MTCCLELLKHNLCLDFLCRTTNILYIRQKQSTQEKRLLLFMNSFLLTLQFTTEYFSTFYFMSFIFDYILVILFHSSCIHGCWVSFGFFIFWGGGGGNNNTAKCCIDLFCLLIHFTHILIGLLNQCRNVLQCVESCRIFVL